MTLNAKTLVKDKFWILEEDGQKLGTLQKKDNNGWIFLSKGDSKETFDTPESLRERFGIDVLTKEAVTEEWYKSNHTYSKKFKSSN